MKIVHKSIRHIVVTYSSQLASAGIIANIYEEFNLLQAQQ